MFNSKYQSFGNIPDMDEDLIEEELPEEDKQEEEDSLEKNMEIEIKN